MAKIVVKQYGGTRRIILTKARAEHFEKELRRVKRASKPHKAQTGTIAPDCQITVTASSGKKTVYDLYGRAVLVNKATGDTWQFYFGLLLLEWLGK